MSRHKPRLHTLQDHNDTPYLFLLNELVDEYLESTEWLLLAGNEGDHLSDLVKTITNAIALILPMYLSSMHLSIFGISLVVKKVR